jgi:hypothetical protein
VKIVSAKIKDLEKKAESLQDDNYKLVSKNGFRVRRKAKKGKVLTANETAYIIANSKMLIIAAERKALCNDRNLLAARVMGAAFSEVYMDNMLKKMHSTSPFIGKPSAEYSELKVQLELLGAQLRPVRLYSPIKDSAAF